MHSKSQDTWLIELDSCASTNSWAMERLPELAHGDCVWTREQQAGRGQNGRSWHSDPGVLTASFVCHLDQDQLGPLMSLCAGLAIAHCSEDLCPVEQVHIKWPNDCFVRGRKLAGVLCEGRQCGPHFGMVIGIGLNVAPEWSEAPAGSHFNGRPPISLRELGLEPATALSTVLRSLRSYLLQAIALLRDQRWQALLPGLRQRDCLLGQHIQVEQRQRRITGIGAGIQDDGSLLIRLPDGGSLNCSSSFSLTVMDVVHD